MILRFETLALNINFESMTLTGQVRVFDARIVACLHFEAPSKGWKLQGLDPSLQIDCREAKVGGGFADQLVRGQTRAADVPLPLLHPVLRHVPYSHCADWALLYVARKGTTGVSTNGVAANLCCF